jgi:two-component system, NarL family, nitrate/nitrite response regulator NarL
LEHHVTVAIVDDHPVVVEGVISWISADPEQRIAVTQVVSDITGLDAPRAGGVLILDLELGGRMIADEVARLTASGYRIVVFSAHVEPALILDVLDAGAYAYVSKDEGRDYLIEAVLAAAADRPCVTRSQAKAILADPRPGRPALSGKERQALLLWFQGMSKGSVARRMSISENTVRQYIDRARVKYATVGRPAHTKDALLARAIEDGLIRPDEVATYTTLASQPRPPVS